MSRYCADSLPENSLVASRKASMSFIYGDGKKFYGVYKVESSNPDSLLSMLKAAHVSAARCDSQFAHASESK
jgi:hypothetical protein